MAEDPFGDDRRLVGPPPPVLEGSSNHGDDDDDDDEALDFEAIESLFFNEIMTMGEDEGGGRDDLAAFAAAAGGGDGGAGTQRRTSSILLSSVLSAAARGDVRLDDIDFDAAAAAADRVNAPFGSANGSIGGAGPCPPPPLPPPQPLVVGTAGDNSASQQQPPRRESSVIAEEARILNEYGVETGTVPGIGHFPADVAGANAAGGGGGAFLGTNQQYHNDYRHQQQQQPPVHLNPGALAPDLQGQPSPASPHPPAAAVATKPAASSSGEEDTSKLVAEFTNLATKLGIRISAEILQSINAPNSTAPDPANGQNSSSSNVLAGALKEMDDVAGAAVAATEARMLKRSAAERDAPAAAMGVTVEATAAGVSGGSRNPLPAAASHPKQAPAPTGTAGRKRRKMSKLQELQERHERLSTENAILRNHLETVNRETKHYDVERKRFLDSMRRALTQEREGVRGTQEDMYKLVMEFSDCYADYGKRRQRELAFHLDQVRRLATPSHSTKLSLWTIAHDDGGSGDDDNNGRDGKGDKGNKASSSGNPLVDILRRELGLTEQQNQRIAEHKDTLRRLLSKLNAVSTCLLGLATRKLSSSPIR